MPSFEEALKSALLGLNSNFQAADADLHREVAAAARVVAQITDGAAKLLLEPRSEDVHGAGYFLTISGKGHRERLANFFVRSSGYPIMVEDQKLDRREAVAEYLASLASNPDSPLVQSVAFLMRHAEPATK